MTPTDITSKTPLQVRLERYNWIMKLTAQGMDLRQIGEIVGLSGERVRQIRARPPTDDRGGRPKGRKNNPKDRPVRPAPVGSLGWALGLPPTPDSPKE